MPQLSLYIDEAQMAELREAAAKKGCSLSRYVAGVLEASNARPAYPEGFFGLYGCLADVSMEHPEDAVPAPVEALF